MPNNRFGRMARAALVAVGAVSLLTAAQTIPAQAASVGPNCTLAQHDLYLEHNPDRVIAWAECDDIKPVYGKLYRNGVLISSVTAGAGIIQITRTCPGTAPSTYVFKLSTGQSDTSTFACG